MVQLLSLIIDMKSIVKNTLWISLVPISDFSAKRA